MLVAVSRQSELQPPVERVPLVHSPDRWLQLVQQAVDVAIHAREIQLALIGRHEKCHFVRCDQPVRRYFVADRVQNGGSCGTIRFCTRRQKGLQRIHLRKKLHGVMAEQSDLALRRTIFLLILWNPAVRCR